METKKFPFTYLLFTFIITIINNVESYIIVLEDVKLERIIMSA